MIDGDENFLSREENIQEKPGLRGEAETRHEAWLVFSLVHCDTVNHAAVTLEMFTLKSSSFEKNNLKSCNYFVEGEV